MFYRVIIFNSKRGFMEQKQVFSKKQLNIGCQIVLILIMLIGLAGYGACVVLFWDKQVWTEAFKTFTDGPILSSLNLVLHAIVYSFMSLKNALIYLVAPIVLTSLFSIILLGCKGKCLLSYKRIMVGICFLSALAGIVSSFVAVIKSSHIAAMVCFIGYGCAIILINPIICLHLGICENCGLYGTKVKTGCNSYTTEHNDYVPGGYSYDSYDLKDKDGVKVGEIETKKYEEAHVNTTYTTHTTYYYTCKNCGHKSERKL